MSSGLAMFSLRQIIFPSLLSPLFSISGFSAEDLHDHDICFNGTTILRPLEWWYFDAVFDNNMSIEFHINLASSETIGVIAPMINIYNNGALLYHDAIFLSTSDFFASKEYPILQIKDKTILEGYTDDSGRWNFKISYGTEVCSINLDFKGLTKPWKARILDLWWWGVLLPNSCVTGTIEYNNKLIQVNGSGYYEHVWDGGLPLVSGWLWGKIISENYSIIWTNMYKNPLDTYVMMVLNENDGDYYNIPYQSIEIEYEEYEFNDGWFIPSKFSFTVDDKKVKLDISAEASQIVHQTSIGTFNYWRYHIHIKGFLKVDSNMEYIDNYQIMDLTRFW
jgi:hypothetical protein